MNVNCKNCGKSIILDESQLLLVETLRIQGNTFGMLQCSFCGIGFSVNPQDLESVTHQVEVLTWRTPISGCHGFVSMINDTGESPFYGCGETGVIWLSKEHFYRDIEAIMHKYSHRKLLYKKLNNEWIPLNNEPNNIEQLIDSEDVEEISNYQR
jgi:hypothetical protein